jgi:hypothetical protein
MSASAGWKVWLPDWKAAVDTMFIDSRMAHGALRPILAISFCFLPAPLMGQLNAFAQVPARARLCTNFRTVKTSRAVFVQGLVWVDTSTYQILRLKTDLLNPLPQIRLNKQTTEIDFQKVQFNGLEQGFWLPREVTVTLDWSGQHLRNQHEYSNFKVYKVEQKNKIGTPKENP